MRENYFNATFSNRVKQEIGGTVIKSSDRTTLGLPDSYHAFSGVVTFFEIKINEAKDAIQIHDGVPSCQPWDAVNDLRQYEVCKRLARCATVLYIIYHPVACTTALIPLDLLALYNRKRNDNPLIWLPKGPYLVDGHGVETFNRIRLEKRKELYDRLKIEQSGADA